jgi:RES domain-containing protein
MRVYRIGSAAFPLFDGGGAMAHPARWSTPPRSIIYAASSYALALLQNVVHWRIGKIPASLRYVAVEIPDDIGIAAIDPKAVPGWDSRRYGASQLAGNWWFDAGEHAIAKVPSVLSPFDANFLINQRHPDFARMTVVAEGVARIDQRLLR